MSQLPTVQSIQDKLDKIFPQGLENRGYLTREMAAKTIFVMIYSTAVEGTDIWIRPDQITKMTDKQAAITDIDKREEWYEMTLRPGAMKDIKDRWYAANTREPIRDETLRYGLIVYNAVIERAGLPTTSSKPRYALQREFYELFMVDENADDFIKNWQDKYLSAESLARVKLLGQSKQSKTNNENILIDLPDGQRRKMLPGPSSFLTKATVELFCKSFLKNPVVIFISESGNKVVLKDDELAKSIGFNIPAEKSLPDLIIADLTDDNTLIYFIEIVATDGPINRKRKDDLLKIVAESSFKRENVFFMTVFEDRNSAPFKKNISSIAPNTLIWFASEPEFIMIWNSLKNYKIADMSSFINET